MIKRVNCKIVYIGIVFLTVFGLAQSVGATGKGYVMGIEGVLAASVPPPGLHWRIFNTLYDTDTLNDDNGDEINNGFDLKLFAQAHRFINITENKVLGADYGFSGIIPIVATDFEIGAAGIKESEVGLGDIFIEPLILAWHGPRYDLALALGFNLPTGDFDSNNPACIGNGYWSGLFSFGGTWFFDSQRSLSVSILTRSLIYGEQDDTDIEPGSEFLFDFGIGKEIPLSKGLLIRPGVCGYGFWQITEDEGPGVVDDKGRVYAIGAEVNLFWLPPSLFQLNLRTLFEFGAKDETEGIKTVLTITKSF